LDIPHFGRGQYANNCIKQLMEVTHGGYLWLEHLVSIDIDIIAYITGYHHGLRIHAQFLEDKNEGERTG
jgi:hypothetical protein